MEEESWKRNHGEGIMEEELWRRNHGGGIMKEDSWRVEHLKGIIGGGIMKEEASGSIRNYLGGIWGYQGGGIWKHLGLSEKHLGSI